MSQRPATELLALRAGRAVTATAETSGTAVLGTVGPSFDLTARLEPRTAGTAGGLRLVTSAEGTEYLDIGLDPLTGELVVDREHASLDPRAHGGTYRVPAQTGAPVDFRLVVDRAVAELYLPSGRTLTLRFYPTGGAPWPIEVRAHGGGLGYTVEAWNLRPYAMRQADESGARPTLADVGPVHP
ncbi:GH32 C-terminal domain-containing protein [Streptomyces anandii]|uniref:GH32 C-terminal domain-containing protein n=1 Tax=Streptomyces anandii TaxID=285454 RepID=A0ABW6HEF0_9ACTN